MRHILIGLVLALATPSIVFAQDVDPARLVAATRVVEHVLPPAERSALAEQMIRPMTANMTNAMLAAPQFAEISKTNPRFAPALKTMLADEERRAIANMQAALPMLADAMARAYARRFDVSQLDEIRTFLETPTGRAYIRESMTMMSDPDIAAAQQTMMLQSMDGLQERIAKFVADLMQEEGKAQ